MKDIEITIRKIEDLTEYANNARKMNERAIDYVATAIKQYGFLQPIVIDRNGVIVCGHVRYRAAKKLKFESVPCVIADDLNEAQIKAFRLADNRVATFAVWDAEKLNEEFAKMTSEDFTMDALGFSDFTMGGNEAFYSDDEAEGAGDGTSAEIDIGSFDDEKFKHECPHCGFRF